MQILQVLVPHFNSFKLLATKFKLHSWDYSSGDSKSGCEVQSVSLSSTEDRNITSVNGDSGKTYDDAMWFYSTSETFNFFPKNIEKFFPNVEHVYIYDVSIATLTKTDLSPFGSQLKLFYFHRSKIEVIESDLFEANPFLEQISLYGNQIKFVADGAFDKLPNLTSLYFRNNPCYSGSAVNDRAAVFNLIKQIERNCKVL